MTNTKTTSPFINTVNAVLIDIYCRATALLVARDEGQSIVEYGMILAIIGLVALAAGKLVGTNLMTTLNDIATALTTR
jgi:Flp pilus assembly pilin Flp